MKSNLTRWIFGFSGAVALHALIIGLVPWSQGLALSERSSGEEADIWGASTNTILFEMATIETVAGENDEVVEALEATAVENLKNTSEDAETTEVTEPEPFEVAEALTEPVEAIAELSAPEIDTISSIDPDSPLEPVKEQLIEEAVKPQTPVVAPKPKPQPPVKKAAPRKAQPPRKVAVETTKPKKQGNAALSVSAASGHARGNNGVREAQAGQATQSNYAGLIVSHLQKYKRYPSHAAGRRITGVATITFSISSNGRVLSKQLRKSSGHSVLDAAALETVQRASLFPAIPVEMKRATMTFTVPLRYKHN